MDLACVLIILLFFVFGELEVDLPAIDLSILICSYYLCCSFNTIYLSHEINQMYRIGLDTRLNWTFSVAP